MWCQEPATLADPRHALYAAVNDVWIAYEQDPYIPLYPRPVVYILPALFELRDIKKVS
jgi:hypothetical protein